MTWESLSFHCDFLAKKSPIVSIRRNTNAEMTHQALIKPKVKTIKNRMSLISLVLQLTPCLMRIIILIIYKIHLGFYWVLNLTSRFYAIFSVADPAAGLGGGGFKSHEIFVVVFGGYFCDLFLQKGWDKVWYLSPMDPLQHFYHRPFMWMMVALNCKSSEYWSIRTMFFPKKTINCWLQY